MKLEVGMYVRTLNGIIKIDKIQNDVMKDTKGCLHYGDFIKASHNIIDLIEVGDYVNGYEVTSKDQFLGIGNHDWYIADYEIKSIVTKEQFESMSYKLED